MRLDRLAVAAAIGCHWLSALQITRRHSRPGYRPLEGVTHEAATGLGAAAALNASCIERQLH